MTYRKLLEELKELSDYQLDNFDVTIIDSEIGEAYSIYEFTISEKYMNFDSSIDSPEGSIANAISSLDNDSFYPIIII